MNDREIEKACDAAAIIVGQAAGRAVLDLPAEVQHIVLASAASSVYSLAASKVGRDQTGQQLAGTDPRVVGLYRAWAHAMSCYPHVGLMQRWFTRARDFFLTPDQQVQDPRTALLEGLLSARDRFGEGMTSRTEYVAACEEIAAMAEHLFKGEADAG